MAMFEGVFKIDKFLTIMNEKGYPGYGNGFDEGMFLRSS